MPDELPNFRHSLLKYYQLLIDRFGERRFNRSMKLFVDDWKHG